MTPEERALARELARCRFIPGSFEKRFARHMATIARDASEPAKPLSAGQARWLRILHHKFRRQIPEHRCGTFCRLEELAGALK